MTLVGEVTIPPDDRPGELTALHYVIERTAWLRLNQPPGSAETRVIGDEIAAGLTARRLGGGSR